MESEPVSETQTLENTYAFLRTDEWKVLMKIFEHYIRDKNKKNIKRADPYWTDRQLIRFHTTHLAWTDIISELESIKQTMWDLPEYIASQDHYYIRINCEHIRETIVLIVNKFAEMKAEFTNYLQDNEYITVKMKYFRQGPNGLWGGVHVKCGKLFGGVQSLHLLSFLRRIYEVFVVPPDPDPDAYPPRWVTWPDISAIPDNFKYRERPGALLIQGPHGGHSVAMPVQRDDRLEEHSMRSDSSGDERDDSDDDMHASMRTWNFGHDSDDERDAVVRDSHRIRRIGLDSNVNLTTMLRNLKLLS
jgi:hypothetical protein